MSPNFVFNERLVLIYDTGVTEARRVIRGIVKMKMSLRAYLEWLIKGIALANCNLSIANARMASGVRLVRVLVFGLHIIECSLIAEITRIIH